MRFYTQQHKHYCGIDLHARTMYICLLRVQDFVSYCRLVKCAKESAGKRHGLSGKKIGNPQLKWAFSEAAVLFLR